MKSISAMAMVLGLTASPVLAAETSPDATGAVKLTDGELDQVVAGDPLILVDIDALLNVHIEPITVNVDVPINVAAVVQANVLGNAVMEAVAVGTQNVFNFASVPTPGG